MNPLESLFNRLEISEHYGHFLSKGVNSIPQLRSLGSSEIMNIAKNKRVTDKLANALSKGTVSVPGSLKTGESKKTKQGVAQDSVKAATDRQDSSASQEKWLTMGEKDQSKNKRKNKQTVDPVPSKVDQIPKVKFIDGAEKPSIKEEDDGWHTKGEKDITKSKNKRGNQHKGEFIQKDSAPINVDQIIKEAFENSEKPSSKEEEEEESMTPRQSENTKPERCKNVDTNLCFTLSDKQVAFLFSEKGIHLREIHEANGTSNQRIFFNKENTSGLVPFTIYGSSLEDCTATKDAIEKRVGITRQKEEDARFHYYMNEINMNIQAMLYIMHTNLKKDASEQLSDSTLRSIASYLSFDKPQGAEHFMYFCKNDKIKKGILDMLIEQFAGRVQMIIYCTGKQAPLIHEHLMRNRMSSQIKPILLVPATKEDRQQEKPEVLKQRRQDALKTFKDGTASSLLYECNDAKETVVQRMLIATDDYARYARTREIPHVNLIIHYSPPKQREWSLFRSETLARGTKSMAKEGIVGYELTLLSENELGFVEELKQLGEFTKLPHEEEQEYFQRWCQTLKPETKENPHVNYKNVEPID